jgi:hypothetical protein
MARFMAIVPTPANFTDRSAAADMAKLSHMWLIDARLDLIEATIEFIAAAGESEIP